MQRKILSRAIFSGASENENVGGFLLRSDGWKNLMMGKTNILFFWEALTT